MARLRISSGRLFCSAGLLGFALLVAMPSAQAAPVKYDLDSQAELDADGWELNSSGGSQTFAGGALTVQSTGYLEWMLTPDSGAPWFTASDTSGWWVEARVELEAIAGCSAQTGPGMWIHDGTNLVQFHLSASTAGITYPELHEVEMTTTGAYHVYRVQSLGQRHLQLVIDGELVADLPHSALGAGTLALNFGDLGGCQTTQTRWDYFAYDTVAPEPLPGDADGDGTDNASDVCVLVADQDQADADGDGIGDACDACPSDAQNDQDGDGLCAGEDLCPEDVRNDTDNNGVCDTEQCAQASPGECLVLCGCYGNGGYGGFVGIDYVGGGGYGAYAGSSVQGGAGSAGSFNMNQSGSGGSNAQNGLPGGGHSGSSGGCGCRLPGARSASAASLPGVMLLLFALGRRRAVRRR